VKTTFGLAVIALLVLVNPGTKKTQSPPPGESLNTLELAGGPEVGEEGGDGDGIEPAPDYVPPEPFIAQEAVPLTGVVGANTLVNSRQLCPNGRGNTQSETMFAVYGDVIVAAFNDSRGFYCPQPRSTLGWAYSFDGGQSFVDGGTLPGGSAEWSNGDPWVVVDPDGNFYIGGISHNFLGMSVSRGTITEDGIAWSDPVQATFGASGTDKDAMAWDVNSGILYLVYDVNAQSVRLVRSEDQGATWTSPSFLPLPGGVGAFPIIDPFGRIYVSWLAGFGTGNQRIVITSSDDYGDTFNPIVEISRVCPFNVAGFSRGQVPAFPSMAQDQTGGPYDGRLYVAFHSSCDGVGTAYLTTSDDGGVTWTLPAVIPDDDSGGIHFSPTVSIDDFRTVNIFFYDRRENPGTGITNVYFTQSFDGGDTFEPNIRITEVATNWSAVASDITPNMGDYMSSKSIGTDVLVNWSDGRQGDPDSYFARLSSGPGAAK